MMAVIRRRDIVEKNAINPEWVARDEREEDKKTRRDLLLDLLLAAQVDRLTVFAAA